MNSTRGLIFLSGGALLVLVWYALSSTVPNPLPETAGTQPIPEVRRKVPPVAMPGQWQRDQQLKKEQKVAAKQQTVLERKLAVRQEREMLGGKTLQSWKNLRGQSEWKMQQLIVTNLPRFELMLAVAQGKTDRKLDCTICEGDAELDLCLICDSDGDCPTCFGKGVDRDGKSICVTCEGRGTCFYCAGRKKLACPFCEDGDVTPFSKISKRPFELP
jgi:hypothetical protein